MSPPLPKTVKTALGILGGAALTSACACLDVAIETTEETGEDTGDSSEDAQQQAEAAVLDKSVLPDDIAELLRDRRRG